MDDRKDTEQPLFLDESPGMPRYSKPSGVPIEELFRDEPLPVQSEPPSRPPVRLRPAGAWAPLPTTGPLRLTGATYFLLFLLAALIAFTAVTAWLA